MSPSAVLLAAGASVRFGGAKLLAPVLGEPLVRRSARALLEGGVDLLLVVTGARSPEVARALAGLAGLRVVENPGWASGMFSSVKAGLSALPSGAGPVAVTPADLPGLSPGDVRRLLEAAAGAPGKIVVPSSGGRRGHPIVLPRPVAEAVASWPDTERLDGIFRESGWPVLHVEGFGPGVLRDADTPEELSVSLPPRTPLR